MTRETARHGSPAAGNPKPNVMEASNMIVSIDPGKESVTACDVQGTSGSKASGSVHSDKTGASVIEAEERKRTGRYLAVCLILVMIFIACYHILMRQMPVLVGLLAPAIIMILYLLWLLYFARKRKRTEITLV